MPTSSITRCRLLSMRLVNRRTLVHVIVADDVCAAGWKTAGCLVAESACLHRNMHTPRRATVQNVMGPWKKYSCGIWPAGCKTLAESEEAALKLVCERAQITNTAGLRVLDMGCGWGSFTLYCATKFPNVQITSVSNSASQKAYIMSEAAKRGLKNVNVITCDINDFDGAGKYFDR